MKTKKQKGFTLIELLAVIVILAIILLVAVPSITNVIENAKEDSLESSARVAVSEATNQYLRSDTYGEFYYSEGIEYNLSNDSILEDNNNIETGYLLITESGETALAFYADNYCAIKTTDSDEIIVTKIEEYECHSFAENTGISDDEKINDDGSTSSKRSFGINGALSDAEVNSSVVEQTFYSVAYINAFDGTPHNLTYTIDLDKLKIEFDQIVTADVYNPMTMSSVNDFETYILKKTLGEISYPSGAESQSLQNFLSDADSEDLKDYAKKLYDHSATTDNTTINNVTVDCTLKCTATIDVTINNLDAVQYDVIEGGISVAYVPTMFTVRFNAVEADLNSKMYYSLGYVLASDTFPKTESYTINIDNLPGNSESSYSVITKAVMDDEIDFRRYIVKKTNGDVSLTSNDALLDINDSEFYYDHSLDGSNMNLDDVVVSCSGGSCTATLTVTVNNIDNTSSTEVDGQEIIYMGSMFEVEAIDNSIAGATYCVDLEPGVLEYDSANNEYIICSTEDFIQWNKDLNNLAGDTSTYELTSNYILAGDIILDSNHDVDENISNGNWVPVGNNTNRFSGTFDGNGYMVNGINVIHDNDYAGLFGYSSGELSNLELININIASTGDYTGSLVGDAHAVTRNIVVKDTLVQGDGLYTGGIAGNIYRSSAYNLYSEAEVIGTTYTGGVMGRNYDGNSFLIVYAGSSVTGTAAVYRTGYLYSNSITNSYALSTALVNGSTVTSSTSNGENVNIDTVTSTAGLESLGFTTEVGNTSSVYAKYSDELAEIILLNTSDAPLDITMSGLGTNSNPYIVTTPEEWTQMNYNLAAYYELGADLDFTSYLSDKAYLPIGSESNHFYGELDGQGYEISNVDIFGYQYTGLFGYTSATLTNIELDNINVVSTGDYAGTLVGRSSTGSLTTINVKNSSVASTGSRIGGVIGEAYNGALHNILADVNVIGDGLVGGVYGRFESGSALNVTYFGTSVSGTSSGARVGYLQNNTGLSNYGSASSLVNGVTVTDSTTNGDTINKDVILSTGGLASLGYKTLLGDYENEIYFNYNSVTDEVDLLNQLISPLTITMAGSGTSGDPYLITTPKEWEQMNYDLDAHYSLSNDLDFTSYLVTRKYIPIGASSPRFSGSLSGNGYTVSNIDITGYENTGLFGHLSGDVNYLVLDNVNVTTSGDYTGGLAGTTSSAVISNINIINSEITSTGNYVGGLIGEVDDDYVRYLYSEATVSGGTFVGGVVGRNDDGGTLNCAYAGPSVTGSTAYRIGYLYRNLVSNNFALNTSLVNGSTVTTSDNNGTDATLSEIQALGY